MTEAKHQRSDTVESINIVTDEDYSDEEEEDNSQPNGRSKSGTVVSREDGSEDHSRRTSSLFGGDKAVLQRIMTSYGGSMDLGNEMGDGLKQLQKEANQMMDEEDMHDALEKMQNMQYTPEEEIQLQKDIQDKINQAFTRYMPEDAHDVDEDEFTEGIKKLGANLTDAEIRKLFGYMDEEGEGYITKDDVQTFVMRPFSNKELISLKKRLLSAMIGMPSVHGRSVSSLMKQGEEQFWSQAQLNMMEEEMKMQLITMATTINEKIEKEETFMTELEKMLEENPDSFQLEKAREWGTHHVVHWLINNDMEYCAKNFFQSQIDGDILLHDLDDMGLQQLGVRPLQLRQFRRKITDLKKIVRGVTDVLLDEEIAFEISWEDPDKQFELGMLQQQLNDALDSRKELEEQIEILKSKNNEFQSTIDAFKENGFLGPMISTNDILDSNNPNVELGNMSDMTSEQSITFSPNASTSQLMGHRPITHMTGTDMLANGRLIQMLKQKKEEMETKDDEDTFCDVQNIKTWNNEEVAYWISSINFPQYTLAFYNMITDGEMLLYDVNNDTLKEDLRVRKIHSRRILHEIEQLKRQLFGKWDTEILNDLFIESNPNKPTIEEIEELKSKIINLEEQRKQLMEELENASKPPTNTEESENENENGEESKDNENSGGKGFFAQQIELLETERDTLKENNEELTEKIENLTKDYDTKIDNLNNEITELTNNNNTQTQEMDEMKQNIEKLGKKIKKLKMNAGSEDMSEEDEPEIDEEELKEKTNEFLEPIKSKADEDPSFALNKNVLEWTTEEVSYWLYRIQMEDYIMGFLEINCDGNMLVNDVNKEWLKQYIKVKPLHMNKILREIERLQSIVGIQNNKNEKSEEEKQLEIERKFKEEKEAKEREELQNQINNLRSELDDEMHKSKGYVLEIKELKQEMEENDPQEYQKKIAELNSIIDYESVRKAETMKLMNVEINSLRTALKVMQREIKWLRPLAEQNAVGGMFTWLGFGGNEETQGGTTSKRGGKKRKRSRRR